ncbi:hypothetical protein D9619_011902 [Psilocybe cf. subviscida]|uniref:Amidohydrolase-related domain-containing protein n=1 Tax=Psilocybe cf. subviscida TaxID=2480587 RepID=A0A8H5B093_9AGAR|nr:hypothetical protein D9619_011902 [Psilocybe cf. subviscida]
MTASTSSSSLDELANRYPKLHHAAFTQPAIDNHAHPLLRESARAALPFEGLISEAADAALVHDAPHTLACRRATLQLAAFLDIPAGEGATWDAVKARRAAMPYDALCARAFTQAGIHCLLIDDGLGGVQELAEDYAWHDRWTPGKTKRIVRVEIEAETILKSMFTTPSSGDPISSFESRLGESLTRSAAHPDVVGFKSIVCYRTGLDVSLEHRYAEQLEAIVRLHDSYKITRKLRLAEKSLNDLVVRVALEVAAQAGIPVQFHTGLGDSDISLAHSSPAHMQPLIKKHSTATFVLLHSSYPYTRDAGYLTAVYPNVFLDFGEVFPFVSADGQRSIIRQVLELSPTNKIMWSSDGHWWPESFYLGAYQARQALFEVLAEYVDRRELTENAAVGIIEGALFGNAKWLYKLDS